MSTTTRCARCGRPVEPGMHLCDQCREEVGPAARTDTGPVRETTDLDDRRTRWPSTMVKPSPVQYHATILVTIFLVLVGLGVWAFLSHRGVGPFPSTVSSRSAYDSGTQSIVVHVTNDGSRTSRATCTLRALDDSERELAVVIVLTDPIPGGEAVDVTHVFRDLEQPPAGYDTVCT